MNVFLAEPGLVKRALALPDLQERPKYALLRNIQEVPDTGEGVNIYGQYRKVGWVLFVCS